MSILLAPRTAQIFAMLAICQILPTEGEVYLEKTE
jgi:hypothetical protein